MSKYDFDVLKASFINEPFDKDELLLEFKNPKKYIDNLKILSKAHECFIDNEFTITQIKRLSDNKIYSIGDINSTDRIKEFKFYKNTILVTFTDNMSKQLKELI